ncbi:bifunctional glutamate N-acetyltransferase/amino-acid acetyltransferase ArgJ [Nesterenkonia sp. HG001]|uniref:bifunctional glutamate N-acetyltransferase/amino-acid acetyltransferase ArgJ n=1 Tax=Nesterenkonia sp. HG001 TaxID=2983207 RepID=UPI002AC5D05F|nr:bifunctional glutamate N-acetyltransferase/amino-acid acetyltransferase ArgJ [Nesterenkonia sp. HG001]MDZ5078824.1 bifunctional glutamate N-acetyltransferase/amino-acid acetyltransferase ArgJ [Nesterenkonia sp. HG001]
MSVTAAAGFTAAGVTSGLKSAGRDLALVVNVGPLRHAAAVFTSNRVAAAPVLWSRQAISDGRADAVVLNSGGANACTGPEGFADTHHTAERVAEALDLSAQDVLVCSTGLIGERLDMGALLPGVDAAVAALADDDDAASSAADAIRTTDSVSKTAQAAGAGFVVGGMAKGAGMLAPGMATMLSVITTDAVISQQDLDSALREAVRVSFDRADSDGCMSTNDTVIAMASGAHPQAQESEVDLHEFQAALTEVCRDLAAQLIADAEGAAHEIAITTVNAASEEDAETAGRSVARSNLFKTAIFGQDPNWGRILSAVGTTDVAFDPATIDVAVNGVWICRGGGIGEDRAGVDLTGRTVQVTIDLKSGDSEATILTNDLTHDYVHENSAYST